MKIVMIEDSEAYRELCRILLEKVYGPDLEIFEESNAADGLKTCRSVAARLRAARLPSSGYDWFAVSGPVELRRFSRTLLSSGAAHWYEQRRIAHRRDQIRRPGISAQRPSQRPAVSLAILKATQKVGLIRELREEHARLARSAEEKGVLLKELHHRVKNNLQIIASLLRLQAKSATDETVTAVLQESQHRVEAIALIHEQLYGSADLRHVPLAQQASLLMENLFSAFGVDPARISGQVVICPRPDGTPLVLGVDQAIPIGLILNELISNALKHAFPDGRSGLIRIEARIGGQNHDGRVELAVVDNGVGVPEDLDTRKRKSLGLEIVEILARQLRGTWALNREAGTTFRLSFPERLDPER